MRQPFGRPLTRSTTVAAMAVTAITWMAVEPHSTVRAAQAATSPQASSPPGIFRQYCVGCHNDRMKANFGNLSLESIDPADVSSHAETLEKVVRRLRKGQMPPLGRPRPDAATLEAFLVTLESGLH